MNQYITLLLSFALSTFAYIVAQPDDVPVQHIEFDDYVIIGQVDESDDGDGANIDMMNAHWCDIWPDDEICVNNDEEKEEEEEGC